MKIMSLPYVILGAVALAGMASFGTWKATSNYVTAKYESEIAIGNAKATMLQLQLTEAKAISEHRLSEAKNAIDKEYETQIRDLDGTIARLRSANVRLQDPGHKASQNTCPTDSGIASGSSETNTPQGLLSEQASEFLFSFARDADDTLEQLRACKNWVTATKKELDDWTVKWVNEGR